MSADDELYRRRMLRNYTKRNKNLRALGFATYGDYLDSDLWKRIRGQVMARDRGKCVGCGGEAKAAHHITYSVGHLRGDCIGSIVAMCHKCHRFIEFLQDGRKARLHDAKKRLRMLQVMNGMPITKI